MMKYQTQNGWTKAKMIETIYAGNKGLQSTAPDRNFPENSLCAYRGSDGNKCVGGCFIPDELYSADMEGNTVGALIRVHDTLRFIMPLNPRAMDALQAEHDLFVPCLGEAPLSITSSLPRPSDLRLHLKAWIEAYVEDAA